MEGTSAHALLLAALRAALSAMDSTSPNSHSVIEALRCAEASYVLTLEPENRVRRAVLLRLCADHLRLASAATRQAAENRALESARRAMTAALFEYGQSRMPRS
jgi:hypothetical protein